MNKILAQSAPAAATPVTLYEVPVQSAATINSLFVCNQGTAATFRLAAVPDGETLAAEHYLYYDVNIQAGDAYVDDTLMFLNEGDSIQIYASSATLSFTLFGNEYKN